MDRVAVRANRMIPGVGLNPAHPMLREDFRAGAVRVPQVGKIHRVLGVGVAPDEALAAILASHLGRPATMIRINVQHTLLAAVVTPVNRLSIRRGL